MCHDLISYGKKTNRNWTSNASLSSSWKKFLALSFILLHPFSRLLSVSLRHFFPYVSFTLSHEKTLFLEMICFERCLRLGIPRILAWTNWIVEQKRESNGRSQSNEHALSLSFSLLIIRTFFTINLYWIFQFVDISRFIEIPRFVHLARNFFVFILQFL